MCWCLGVAIRLLMCCVWLPGVLLCGCLFLMCCGWLPECCYAVVCCSCAVSGCQGVALRLVMCCVWMPRCCYEVANVLCVVFRVLLMLCGWLPGCCYAVNRCVLGVPRLGCSGWLLSPHEWVLRILNIKNI